MGYLADSSAKTLPFLVMSLNMPRSLVHQLQFFHLTKKKLLIVSTGVSCAPRSLPWGSVHLSSFGWICSIHMFRVLSTLMVIFPPFLVYLMVSGRVVPCLPFFISLCLRSRQPQFTATPVSLVSVFLALPPCRLFPNMLMTRP